MAKKTAVLAVICLLSACGSDEGLERIGLRVEWKFKKPTPEWIPSLPFQKQEEKRI